MISIKDLQDTMKIGFSYAEKNEVDKFIVLYTDMQEHLYHCLKLTVSTIPTLENMATMKWAIVKVNSFTTFLFSCTAALMGIGIHHIDNTIVNTTLTFLLTVGVGIYLWDRVKMISANVKHFAIINDHEKQMLEGLSYYITVAQILKPFSIYGEMIIDNWKKDGLYTEETKEDT